MKITIALVLCCVVYASAEPRCSEDEFNQCQSTEKQPRFHFLETSEELQEKCRYILPVVDCQADYLDRCPELFSGKRDYTKSIQRIYRVYCDESNPLRKKFLDDIQCLNQFAMKSSNICGVEKGFEGKDRCKKLKSALNCIEQTVADTCGEDARAVYLVNSDPVFQLRLLDCM